MQAKNNPRFMKTAATLAAVCLLAACGGSGDDDDGTAGISNESAEGYAADSAAMPVVAADGVDLAIETVESGLAAGAAGGEVGAQSVDGSRACAGGGTVSWTVTSLDAEDEANGRLDAGEVVDVEYAACIGADGTTTLDGSLQLTVNERDDDSSDLTLLVSGLELRKPAGSFTVGGGMRLQRETVALDGGGSERRRTLSSESVAMVTMIGERESNYRLRDLDWTVVKTYDAGGAFVSRTHDGELTLEADNPRRPDAQLAIDTDGALTVGTDGYVSAGRLVATSNEHELTATWAAGSVTITLDLGRDGSIDRSWTITRDALLGRVG
jgi:hypothetical protein